MEEAFSGNALTMHDLRKMLAAGIGVEADTEQAQAWYAKALSAFQTVEQQRPNRYVEYQKMAKHILADSNAASEQTKLALNWLTHAAEARLDCAQYNLGKLYLLEKE